MTLIPEMTLEAEAPLPHPGLSIQEVVIEIKLGRYQISEFKGKGGNQTTGKYFLGVCHVPVSGMIVVWLDVKKLHLKQRSWVRGKNKL